MSEIGVEKELEKLRHERKLTERILSSRQAELKDMLLGDMGRDMKSVLNGETVIGMPKGNIIRHRLKLFFKRIFSTF